MNLINKLADYNKDNLNELNILYSELMDTIRILDYPCKINNISEDQSMNIVTRIDDINELVTETCNEISNLLRELDEHNITRSKKADERQVEYDDQRAMIELFGPYIVLFNMFRQQNRLNSLKDNDN